MPSQPQPRPVGRPPLPRRAVRQAFTEHVRSYLIAEGISLRQLCRRALGDDSDPTYYSACSIVSGTVQADGTVYRARLAAIARAAHWPSDSPADELIKVKPLPAPPDRRS